MNPTPSQQHHKAASLWVRSGGGGPLKGGTTRPQAQPLWTNMDMFQYRTYLCPSSKWEVNAEGSDFWCWVWPPPFHGASLHEAQLTEWWMEKPLGQWPGAISFCSETCIQIWACEMAWVILIWQLSTFQNHCQVQPHGSLWSGSALHICVRVCLCCACQRVANLSWGNTPVRPSSVTSH